MLLSKNGISSNLSPVIIILGSPKKYYNKIRIRFVSYDYEQVYIGTTTSTKQRSVGDISLRPENKQGGYYLMYLETEN